jgi:hypothetical protein
MYAFLVTEIFLTTNCINSHNLNIMTVIRDIYYYRFYCLLFEYDAGIIHFNQFLNYFLHEETQYIINMSRGVDASNELQTFAGKNPETLTDLLLI